MVSVMNVVIDRVVVAVDLVAVTVSDWMGQMDLVVMVMISMSLCGGHSLPYPSVHQEYQCSDPPHTEATALVLGDAIAHHPYAHHPTHPSLLPRLSSLYTLLWFEKPGIGTW